MLHEHKEVVPECDGCTRVQYSIVVKRRICGSYVFPKCQWWFGGVCDQATHHPPKKPIEDPIKEP